MTIGSQARYFARLGVTATKRPLETYDRFCGALETVRHSRASHTPFALQVHSSSMKTLHGALETPWPCPYVETFATLWSSINDRLRGNRLPVGVGNDADFTFVHGLWCLSMHLPVSMAVETGVARGISSAAILASFKERQTGRLWSIDMPPLRDPWHYEHQAAIPPELRGRWTYVRGSSRRQLPRLLTSLGFIDLFVHDSSRTKRNMLFEMTEAWRAIRDGGAMVVNGVGEHDGFEQGLRSLTGARFTAALAMSGEKGGVWGVILK